MCDYCNQETMKELPEAIDNNGNYTGRIFNYCIDSIDGKFYIMTPLDFDIPIKYCPYYGRSLEVKE